MLFSIVPTYKIFTNYSSPGPKESKISSSRTTGPGKEVFVAVTCPKFRQSSFFNPYTLTYSSCKNCFRWRDKGHCHCVFFFLHMKWMAMMLIVFGHHEDCAFDVNTHTHSWVLPLGVLFWYVFLGYPF